MRERKTYICDLCGTEYRYANAALQCENGHKTGLIVHNAFYKNIGLTPDGWPTKIEISSGNEIRGYKII